MSLVITKGYEAYEEIIMRAYKKLDPIEHVNRHGSPVRKIVLSAAEVADHPSIPDDIIKIGVTFEAEIGQRQPDAKPHYIMREVVLRRVSDRNYIVVPEKGKSRKETREAIDTVGKVRKRKTAKKPAAKPAAKPESSNDEEFND